MSSYSKDQFNVWFPALVCGLVIGLIAAVSWDILRRRFWYCASRFWPGVLREVGLDNLSRVEVEEKMRLVSDMLSAVHTEVTKPQITPSLPTARAIDSTAAESSNSSNSSMSSIDDFDLEGQEPVIQPFPTSTGRRITFTATAYFPDGTPTFVIRPVKRFFKRHGNGTVKRWKSSIVLQASLSIEACVVSEYEELARISILEENQCTFQLGNWAIIYYKAGEICLHELKEGDVPVNVEARWQEEMTCIKMRGLYLNGAQVKVATKHTSTILRSVGPATKGHGDFDELNFNIEDLDVPREDAIIFAAKLIDGDGIPLIVRSEASFIRPQRAKSTVTEAFWSQLPRFSQFAKMMKGLLFRDEVLRPAISRDTDLQVGIVVVSPHFFRRKWPMTEIIQYIHYCTDELEIETVEKRNKVLHYLQELRVSNERHAPMSQLNFIRDKHSIGYWQRVLQELNEVILQYEGCSQFDTFIRLRGGIRFLLDDYEDALHDLDLAHMIMQEDHWTILYERALVKCMLARYSEASADVCSAISMNPNFSDIQELKTCIQHILEQQTPLPTVQDGSLRLVKQPHPMVEMYILKQQKLLPTVHDGSSSVLQQPQSMVEIPDLLTGDEWHSGGGESSHIVPSLCTSGGSTSHAYVTIPPQPTDVDQAQPIDVTVATGADAWPLNSQPDGDLPHLDIYGHQWDPFLLALAAGSGSLYSRTESLSCWASSRDEAQLWQEVVNDVGQQITSSDLMDVVGVEEYGVGPEGSTNSCQVLENMGATSSRELSQETCTFADYRYYHVQLIDFGLSKAEIRAAGSLEPAVGTKMYRAPEVFSQDGRVSEKRYPLECDASSFGLLASDILTGKVLCEAIPPTRLNEALLSNARPKLPSSLPEKLASIIRDCWAEDPADRPLFGDICRILRSVQRRLNSAPHHGLDPPVSTYAHGECSESADSSFVSESHVRNNTDQAAEVDVSKLVNELITDLSSRETEVHRDAAHQIRCMTKMNSENRLTIAEQGAIPFLINLLWSPDKMTQEHAVTALMNLSLLETNRALIVRAGAIDGIVHVVKWGLSMEARENAAATIQNDKATHRCKRKAEQLFDLLSGGAQLRQKVVKDRPEQLNLRSQLQMMKATRNEPQAQPRVEIGQQGVIEFETTSSHTKGSTAQFPTARHFSKTELARRSETREITRTSACNNWPPRAGQSGACASPAHNLPSRSIHQPSVVVLEAPSAAALSSSSDALLQQCDRHSSRMEDCGQESLDKLVEVGPLGC